MAKFHLASFNLEDCISFHHIFNTDEPINAYTDGLKTDGRPDCSFCVSECNISTAQWMTQLNLYNSVLEAELLLSKKPALAPVNPINLLKSGPIENPDSTPFPRQN
ncbi:hypothetical protein AVEN_43728-1 [Araneus ventricosus]|uniref:Uncharacterized protein n=1 Tax=Araneus ventricosus TaxID=182803 RepID=A0A4Y2BZ66_ARAVE|nr:hypothetical protein AVEN_43728-1 [Araneus ventricosus]